MPELRRTRATLRRAEFGFLGVVVYTRVHTPRRCGHASRARDLLLISSAVRPLRTSCCIVGIREPFLIIFIGSAKVRYISEKTRMNFPELLTFRLMNAIGEAKSQHFLDLPPAKT